MMYNAEKSLRYITAPNTYAPTEDKSDDWGIRAGMQSVSKVMRESVIDVNAHIISDPK